MHFSAQGSSFFFVKYGARPFFARPFFNAQIFFHDFFLYECILKMESSVFLVGSFDWNRFGNRFGNNVTRLKKQ